MGFNTTIPGHVLIGDEDVIFGTAMLGDAYGEITKCDLELGGDEINIENNRGGTRAMILANPTFKMTIETVFSDDVALPGLGDSITMPEASVVGRILKVKPGWTSKGSRMLSIEATHWQSMGVETAPSSGIFANPAFSVAPDGTATPIT